MYPVDNAMPAGKSGAKILVLGPAWVGDMVLAQSLFKTLKINDPDCTIDVAAPAWTLPLVERMPEINNAIALPFKHGKLAFWQRIRLGLRLKKNSYDQAIILTNSFKSAILPFTACIPKRTSFIGEMRYGLINDIRNLNKTELPRTVDRFVMLGLHKESHLPEHVPQPKLLSNPDSAHDILKKLGIAVRSSRILGLCPGAEYGEAKRWPTSYYAQVANYALERGWQVWLFGSQKDAIVTNEINVLTDNKCENFSGQTTLAEVIDLMSLTSAIVSNDSGLMHIGAALGKPLMAVYGSSDPAHTPPMDSNAKVFYLNLSCSPCFARVCPLGHLNCLKGIQPQQVINSLENIGD